MRPTTVTNDSLGMGMRPVAHNSQAGMRPSFPRAMGPSSVNTTVVTSPDFSPLMTPITSSGAMNPTPPAPEPVLDNPQQLEKPLSSQEQQFEE